MALIAMLRQEFEHETSLTRRLLERVPDGSPTGARGNRARIRKVAECGIS